MGECLYEKQWEGWSGYLNAGLVSRELVSYWQHSLGVSGDGIVLLPWIYQAGIHTISLPGSAVLFFLIFTMKPSGSILVFDKLRLSTEHHKWVNINAPPHSEACFSNKRGSWYKELILATVSAMTAGLEPRFSRLRVQYSTVELSHYCEHVWRWLCVVSMHLVGSCSHVVTPYGPAVWSVRIGSYA